MKYEGFGNVMSRRNVLKLAAALPFLSIAPVEYAGALPAPGTPRPGDENHVRLGIIGFGIRGEQLVRALGFVTPAWLAKMKGTAAHDQYVKSGKLNVTIHGICDLYQARAENALKTCGKPAVRFRDYRAMLESKEIDAVVIATPDHLHARMIIDAAQAGKHVYVEKCMTHTAGEANQVYDAVKKSGIAFQLGHQLRQNATVAQARDLLTLDVLGKISVVETSSNRNSPNAAWVYDIPADASPATIDWAQFDPGRPFDADRFFRWRKYWDYGTGLSGDLLTHEFDTMNAILSPGIPDTAVASGGIYHYHDGREVPDVFEVAFEFGGKAFTMTYSATLGNDYHRPALYMGRDATLRLDNRIEVIANASSAKYKDKFASGQMKPGASFYTYPPDEESQVPIDAVSSATNRYFAEKGMMTTMVDGKPVDPTRLHLLEWLLCIANKWVPSCNVEAGYVEAIAAHMATTAYKTGRKVGWDGGKKMIIDK